MNKKGQLTYAYVFGVVMIFLIILVAFVAPFGIKMSTAGFQAGEVLINSSVLDLANIEDSTMRDEINQSITSARQSTSDNIETMSNIYQYGWLIILIITLIIIILLARRNVQIGGIG